MAGTKNTSTQYYDKKFDEVALAKRQHTLDNKNCHLKHFSWQLVQDILFFSHRSFHKNYKISCEITALVFEALVLDNVFTRSTTFFLTLLSLISA